MFYNTILAIFLYLKRFFNKLHEIYIVASQKFEEFENECPHYTLGKELWKYKIKIYWEGFCHVVSDFPEQICILHILSFLVFFYAL